jgi:hypothetical protein
MLFTNAARRITSSSFRSAGVRCLSSTKAAAPKAAAPILLAGAGLTALGLTYNNYATTATTTQCLASTSKVEEAVKAVEDKFVTYWPRNIMVRLVILCYFNVVFIRILCTFYVMSCLYIMDMLHVVL